MNRQEKILVRGVNWLGDAVMILPALQRLREARPHSEITLLTHQKLAGLWERQSLLDHVIPFDPTDGWLKIGRSLRSHRFDVALVFPNSLRSALEVFSARIPVRVGRSRFERNLFLTRRIPVPVLFPTKKVSPSEIQRRLRDGAAGVAIPASAHHIHHYLALTAALGGSLEPSAPSLEVHTDEIEAVLSAFSIGDAAPLIGVNPGAEYGPAKRWLPENYAAAVKELLAQTGGMGLLFGGAGDMRLAEQIACQVEGSRLRNLAGKTTLRQLCVLLKACDVVVTNDSGPMHVASALGTPVVVPFGSTSPELTGPGMPGNMNVTILRSGASCSPCFLRECPIDFRCMTGIKVPQVVEAALALLSKRARIE